MMRLSWASILKCCILCSVFSHASSAGPSYYITAPSFLRPDVNTSFAVHWFGTSYSTINVTAEIFIRGSSQPLVFGQKSFNNDSIGILTLPAIPQDTGKTEYLMVVNGSAKNELLFSREFPISLQFARTGVLVELDRYLYKPRQTVKIRVIALVSGLKPFHGKIDIYIRDPENNLVQQWLGLNTSMGVVSQDFLLSAIPYFGAWTVDVRANEAQTFKAFTVADYVVPKFEVSVFTPAVYITDKQENLTVQITAKYRYGDPVRGTLILALYTPWYYFTPSLNKTQEISGSVNFTFSYDELQSIGVLYRAREARNLWDPIFSANFGNLNFNVTVKESLTGIEVKEYYVLPFTNAEYIFFDDSFQFKRNLKNRMTVKVQRSDQLPLTKREREKNVSVLITQYNYGGSREENVGLLNLSPAPTKGPNLKQYVISENGEINIEFQVSASTTNIAIEIHYQNLTHNIWRSVMWQQTNSSILIWKPSSLVKVGVPLELMVETSENVKEINYVVLSKGQAVAAGKTDSGAISLTPQISWAPSIVINVYYIHSSNHVIMDSRVFNVKGIFQNKVSLSWSKAKAKASENVLLVITVEEPSSLVGLRVLEKGTDGTRITEAQVVNDVLFGEELGGQSISDGPIQYFETQREADWSNFPGNVPSVGNSFSEPWLWWETNISSGNKANLQFRVPKTLTTWAASAFVISDSLGLGVTSTPVELQVFLEFYISVNVPYSVTRGEQFILEVMIISQLAQTQEVTITLELQDSFEIVGASSTSSIPNQRKASVPSQSGGIVLFPISPKQLGEITFKVNATTPAASDEATKTVLVKAEGIQQFYSQSVVLEGSSSAVTSLSFAFPSNVVNGSEQSYITAVGDLLGPTVDGLESLIRMPYGCGEQNMINFCPNIYILLYLNATSQTTPAIRDKAITSMLDGYQRELTYRRKDGSFSAFGNSDQSGSTWLSSFVLRCFLMARPFIAIDDNVLQSIIRWLITYQNTGTGEFSEPGRVIHTELQGGQNGPITLTAYILTAVLEDETYRNTYRNEVIKAIKFLEKKFQEGISSNYTLAVVTYALSLANSNTASSALDQLNGRAERAGGLMYWSNPAPGIANYWQPRSSEIEMAAYALLACAHQNRNREGVPIFKWLGQQRSRFGGYSSTQDTIVGLHALSHFAAFYTYGNGVTNVVVTGPASFVQKSFHFYSLNRLVQQRYEFDVFRPLGLDVVLIWSGLAICQLNVAYNIMPSARRRRSAGDTETFTLNVTVQDNKNDLNRVTVQACTSYNPSVYANQSGMALMEVYYLSGFTLDQSIIIQNELLKKVEPDNGKVNLYFDSISGTPVCVAVPMLRDAKVSSSQDAVISMMDYYQPRTQVTRMYNSNVMKSISVCDFCGKDCSLCRSNIVPSGGGGVGVTTGTNGAVSALTSYFAHLFLFIVSMAHLLLLD